MASQCPVYNHDKYVSSDDDDDDDKCSGNFNSNHHQPGKIDSHSDKPNSESVKNNSEFGEHSKADKDKSGQPDDNSQLGVHSHLGKHNYHSDTVHSQSDNDYSSESEKEFHSDDEIDDFTENNNKLSSGTEKRDSIEDGNEKVTAAEIVPYSHRQHHRRRHHSHRPRRRRQQYTQIKLPTGRMAAITKPHTTGWKCGRRTKLITLKQNGRMGKKEYNLVANEMKNTFNNTHNVLCQLMVPATLACDSRLMIIKIQKLENGCLWRKYRDYQNIVRREVGYTNERLLFHGTTKVTELLKHGFDERFASMTGMFGAGIYFAQHSAKSNKYVFGLNKGCKSHKDPDCTICVRRMFLCRVTLGNVEEVTMPKTFAHAPPGKHSVEGKPGMALEYPEHVIYRGEQAYPEYLVTYKKK